MSSRAVRRAQRNQEIELARSPSPLEPDVKTKVSPFAGLADEEEEEEEEVRSKPSLFALLGAADESPVEDQTDEGDEKQDREPEPEKEEIKPAKVASSRKKKVKKNKKKPKTEKESKEENGLDEIDKALAELNMKTAPRPTVEPELALSAQKSQMDARLLSVNTRNFDPEREMRKLFGRRVFQEEAQVRRGGAQRGLARPMASRRYVLVQPGDDWPPLIGASGMTMEVVGSEGDITSFKFTHSRLYMGVQARFYMCLQIGDPEFLVDLFRDNRMRPLCLWSHANVPVYHISTNLQMAEILTHQGDHSKAAKCIEHALFTFNKSFHPLFNISSGRVRLPYKYYENRGFYLTVYRHVRNLERKGTWVTAFEFMKLLLEVSAEEDSYCVLLMIDVYALHAQNYQFIIDLASSHIFSDRVPDLPNIAFSLALAHLNENTDAEASIDKAASAFPWTLSALAFALGLDVPPQLMRFNEPPSVFQQILTQLYVSRALPLWSTPAAKSFLAAAIERVKAHAPRPSPRTLDPKVPISRDLVRHVLLTDIKPALTLLPRESVQEEIWTDDMLPPLDNISPYATNPLSSSSPYAPVRAASDTAIDPVDERGLLEGLWNSIAQFRRARRDAAGQEDDGADAYAEEEFVRHEIEELATHAPDQGDQGRLQAGQSYLSSLLRRFAGGIGLGSNPEVYEDQEDGEDDFLSAEEYDHGADTE